MSPREADRAPRPDPLALDPYSPVAPTPDRNDQDPLALDPYSPVVGTQRESNKD